VPESQKRHNGAAAGRYSPLSEEISFYRRSNVCRAELMAYFPHRGPT